MRKYSLTIISVYILQFVPFFLIFFKSILECIFLLTNNLAFLRCESILYDEFLDVS